MPAYCNILLLSDYFICLLFMYRRKTAYFLPQKYLKALGSQVHITINKINTACYNESNR